MFIYKQEKLVKKLKITTDFYKTKEFDDKVYKKKEKEENKKEEKIKE